MASSLVTSTIRPDGVAVLRICNPPVNALSSSVQRALSTSLKSLLSNSSVKGIVIAADSSAGFFSSGADVSEFASISSGHNPFSPEASWVYEGASSAPIPVVAAIDGVCFGGGLELTFCCAARVATPRSKFSLPELKLGIIPGLGGTQRLPRLVGFELGMQMMLRSATISASEGLQAGVVDEVIGTDCGDAVVEAAARAALKLRGKQTTPALERADRIGSLADCQAAAKRMEPMIRKLSRGGHMPHYAAAVRAALHGVEHGGEAGLREEAREFQKLVTGSSSLGIVHLFFAARKTAKVPLGPVTRAPKAFKSVGVIGGGLMGAGIATAFLTAGIRVVIKEVDEKFVEPARARVRRNLGKKTAAMELLSVTTEYTAMADVDMVVEAAPEIPQLKISIFKALEEVCRPDCILASNTSTINIDLIGMGCPAAHQSGRLVGAHFFSPAHKMPLLEIVRTESTAPEVVADLLALAKRIKKVPVVVGNCAGFAVNRMYFPQSMVAGFLVELGVDPFRIDAACEKFGLPMGPFRLLDLVGMDIGVAVCGVFDMAYADRSAGTSPVISELLKAGRKGQKSDSGFYKYTKGVRGGVPDPAGVMPFVQAARSTASSKPGYAELERMAGSLSDQDIVDMILLACVNEGCRILDEGVAVRASDLDICSAMGMAFPQFRGGLMYWAETTHGGAAGVRRRLKSFYEMSKGFSLFKPAFALDRSADMQAPLGKKILPELQPGKTDDIVVVSGFRTAVGRAGRGGFKDTLPDDMIAPVLERILKTTKVSPRDVGDVVIGNVLQRGDTGVVQVRVAGILSGLPVSVPIHTVNRLCSSGLQAIADAAASITAGHYEIAIAGGMESMSSASMNNTELRPNPKVAGNVNAANCYLNMGKTSENVAEKYGISRERQDRMAVVSHARASLAKFAGRQKGEIVPIKTKKTTIDRETKKVTGVRDIVVEQDEGVRMGVTMDRLAKLPAVFKKGGSTTPGNSSQLSDGAAAVMLMKRSEAERRGIEPLASLRGFSVAGVDPAVMGIGPAVAIPMVLEKCGLTKEDIDLFEINEAFGSQADYCIEKLGLNRDVVNVMGGAIAIGHPLGMTGARQTVSIVHELRRRGGRFGVVSMCIGSGMGAAAVYEVNSSGSGELSRL